MFEQSNKLRFEVALFFTIRFFICHVSGIRIKTRENGRILDWRGGRPDKLNLHVKHSKKLPTRSDISIQLPTRQDYHIQ